MELNKPFSTVKFYTLNWMTLHVLTSASYFCFKFKFAVNEFFTPSNLKYSH